MANKVKNIRALSSETAREITQSPENWMKFLDTASRVYKYPFHEQMLIYAQRPDAIACASIEVWNKNLRRWVNRGSKGIALLDDSGSYLKLKYVFDFTDTHPGYQGLVPFIWKMETSFHEPVLSHLEETYSFEAPPSNLPDALLGIGKSAAAENYPDYLEDFRRSVSGSFLSDLDDLNLELLFRRTLTASVQYTLLKRCGFDPEDYLSREDFADIHSFNTVDTLSQVGFAVNETARPVLIDIGREIRSIILGKLRDYPLADPQRMPYNEFITLIRESKEKGGPSNEQSVIQDSRGLPDPGTDHREAADNAAGQIRDDAQDLSEAAPGRHIPEPASERPAERTSAGDRPDRPGADRVADGPAAGERTGSGKGERSHRLGGTHEYAPSDSGRDRLERTDLQLEGPDLSPDAAAEEVTLPSFPSVDAQIRELGTSDLPEMFTEHIPRELLDEVLIFGSNEKDSSLRIAALFMEEITPEKRTVLLAQEYGTGTVGIRISNAPFVAAYDPYGIHLYTGDNLYTSQETFSISWENAHDRIRELLSLGQYLPQELLDQALPNECQEAALSLLYLYHDFDYDGHEFSYFDPSEITGDYPKDVEVFAGKLASPESLAEQISILEKFYQDYQQDSSILRFHYHKISKLLDRLQRLSLPRIQYPAQEDYILHPLTKYIPKSDIEDLLSRHSEDGKLSIYSFFLRHPDPKDRAEFLKNSYGTGGRYPAGENNFLDMDYEPRQIRFMLHTPDGSDDQVSLNWNQASKIIDGMIRENRFLGENTIQHIPVFQVKYLARELDHFLHALPDDLRKQMPFPAQSEDTEQAVASYMESITDPDALAEIILFMDSCLSKLPPDMEEYPTLERYAEDLTEYHDGVFSLFPIPEPQEQKQPTKKERVDSQEEIDGQLSFLDQLEPDLPEGASEPMDIPIGLQLTIDDREFQIDSVNYDTGKVSLTDLTFLKAIGFPISREEDLSVIKDRLAGTMTADISEQVSESPAVDLSEAEKISPQNFRITEDDPDLGGPKGKFHANIQAIQILQALEADDRPATPEEQIILSHYSGWGGLSKAFDPDSPEWSKEYRQLKSLLTPQEYEAARSSTLNAFYTPPAVIRSMYQVLSNMGFSTGNVLEPSCGTGNFFGCLPEGMDNSRLYGIELDSLTGRIAQKLYPKAQIQIDGFERTSFPNDFFDVVIGNVPFGNYQVPDRRYDRYKFPIHDYFIAKSLDQVRPGGLVAVVTSSGTLDKENPAARKYFSERADLLGAVRLSEQTFQKNAGTNAVTDILFLQKRDRAPIEEPSWVQLGETSHGCSINQYYIEHPEMILGDLVPEQNQYGEISLTVKARKDLSLEEQLSQAVSHIQGSIQIRELSDSDLDLEESIPADPDVPNFSYTLANGQIYYRENSLMNRMDLPAATAERVKGMIELRDTTRTLLKMQLEDSGNEAITKQMELLNQQYDTFTAKWGLINSTGNQRAFSQDASYYLLSSLEILDEEGNLKEKADIFRQRTIRKPEPVQTVDSAVEALSVSMGEKACVDLVYMSSLYGKPEEEICEELRGLIFKAPVSEQWQTADEYLSGNVREKLRTAEIFAESHPEYQINVESLQKVQPQDLTAPEIHVRLGVTWIEPEEITQFMQELLGTPKHAVESNSVKVLYSPASGEWNVKGKSAFAGSVAASVTYGTQRASGYRLLQDALNQRQTKIYDVKLDASGNEVRIINQKETLLAQQKQDLIKEAFQDWVFKEPQRRERLVKRYNERFNCIRPREYDGSHLRFPGMNPSIKLRPHQKNVIARILYGGNCLAAHAVGAGKTFSCIAAAMESKRLGLCSKSMFVVPNHLIGQWSADILRLYPNAKVLAATKKDFEPANRKRFCSRIATGDYDCVVIGHTQFEKIPLSEERQKATLYQQIDEIVDGIRQAKEAGAENFTIKQMEGTRKKLEAKLTKLTTGKAKDHAVTFEELGVDRLFVDESQNFKNLYVYTKMTSVAGVSTTDAQKSSDMLAKCRYMDELTGGKGVTFATGTPLSNSMTELYTLMRYLQADMLREMGLTHFDSWAAQFGETVSAIELAPEGTGYRAKTRFARFFNLPELMAAWKECADIQTSDMLNLPTPKPLYENVIVSPSEIQKDMVAELAQRAEAIRNHTINSELDNMLCVTNDGRKLALDQRLIDPRLPDDSGSKVNACVEKTFQLWQDTAADKRTQVIFCDQSTPKSDGSFNVYDDIKAKLITRGVPEKEIAFIHDASTDAQKSMLFSRVRSGQVRIVLASTSKMGAGTNIQDKLLALHHLDVPWRPSDVEQQEGRILRQGNTNPEVHIYRYITEQTFDAFMWQTLENKQKFISQVMTSKSPARSCEDMDQAALNYAEVKALASGNPLIMEKTELDTEVAKLKMMKASYTSRHYDLEDALLRTFPKELSRTQSLIAGLQQDARTASQNLPPDPDHFRITILGKVYTEKKEAGAALLEACKQSVQNGSSILGEYAGFTLSANYSSFSRQYHLSIAGQIIHDIELGDDPSGNLTRINNALLHIPQKLEAAQKSLDNIQNQIAEAKAELQRPFPQEELLNEKQKRLNEVNAMLDLDKKEDDLFLESEESDDISESNEECVSFSEPDDDNYVFPDTQITSPGISRQTCADQPRQRSILSRLQEAKEKAAQHTSSVLPALRTEQSL